MRLRFFNHNYSKTQFVELNTSKCKACWKCIGNCLNKVIGKVDLPWHKHAIIDSPDNCSGCFKCVKICEYGAYNSMKTEKMKITTQRKPINKRAFVSIAMFVSLMGLPVSGIMNHQLQFVPLTQERHFWMSIHNVSAILFVVMAIIHIAYNWRVLLHYAQKAKEIAISKEAIMAVVLVVIIVGVISSHAFHVSQ